MFPLTKSAKAAQAARRAEEDKKNSEKDAAPDPLSNPLEKGEMSAPQTDGDLTENNPIPDDKEENQ